VPSILRECVERGVRAALIHAAGFAETGTPEGLVLQREVERIVATSDLRVAGPNCLGLWNFRRNLSLARRLHHVERAGHIGIASQSGGLGSFLFDVPGAASLFSYCLCTGNSLDIDVFDLVNFLVEDEHTRAIALVLEGIGDAKPAAGGRCAGTRRGQADRGVQVWADRERGPRRAVAHRIHRRRPRDPSTPRSRVPGSSPSRGTTT